MTRLATVLALVVLLAAPSGAPARERGGGSPGVQHHSHRGHTAPRHHGGGHSRHHGGYHHHHHHSFGPRTYFFGSFWYPGWAYRPYFHPHYPYYPYYPPYPYPPSVPYPTSEEPEEPDEAPAVDADRVSYGLIQLEGVPDGAAVDLDGRFWLTANDLDDRWLALPEGEHRIAVRVEDDPPTERTVRIVPGKTHVLRFGVTERPT